MENQVKFLYETCEVLQCMCVALERELEAYTSYGLLKLWVYSARDIWL